MLPNPRRRPKPCRTLLKATQFAENVENEPERDQGVQPPEQDATDFVARNHLHGRMVVFFNWGEYVLWQFRHDLTVSTDGRRETVYSDRQINGHLELYRGTDSGLTYFHQLNADYVWLPTESPAVDKLRAEGWVEIYARDRSAILARPSLVPAGGYIVPAARCYPGPRARTSPLSAGFWRVTY